MGSVEQSISAAQSSVDEAGKQLAAQREQIATLEGQVTTQHDLIATLLAQIEHLGSSAPPALRSSASAVRAQALAQPLQKIVPVNAALLQEASRHLAAARAATAQLRIHP